MGELVEIVTPLHRSTARDYLARMNDDKVACMKKAREYGPDYWDGDRRFGYGGYRYIPGRWKPVAEALISRYGLTADSRVLDVGCGKAFLLYEIQQLLPGITLHGIDVSEYALEHTHPGLEAELDCRRAEDGYPFAENSFDLVISLATLHNLPVSGLAAALREIGRVGRRSYVMVESYRDERELFNLQCWALTARSFFGVPEWEWLFEKFGYSGDYEFIFFE